MSQNVKEISLGDGFGEVAVRANGARVVIHADGKVESRDVREASVPIAPQVGDPMPDGTIYAGISPVRARQCTRRQKMPR